MRKSYSILQDDFFNAMQAAGYTDVLRGERGSTEEHLTVTQFKVQQEQHRLTEIQEAQVAASAEVAQLDADKVQAEKDIRKAEAKLECLAPQVERIEELVRKYPDDPDKVLPEAGAFESARVYREKKAMPLVKKLVKWVHSLFRKNLELTNRCATLERSKAHDVGIWKHRAERAETLIQQLRMRVEQFDHVNRLLGQEQIDQLLAQPIPAQEHMTKRQKGAER